MKLLTKTFLVSGRNRNLLFQKIAKNKINALKIKIINEKFAEITIDNKDCLKYFAICKNMWYNKLVKVGGILAPFYLLVKNPLKTIALTLSLCIILLGENLYFKTDYQGDSLLVRPYIERLFAENGINKYCFVTNAKLQSLKSQLQKQENVGYARVEKVGNKIIVDLRLLKNSPSKPQPLKTDLIANENMKILKATVYSGTLLKGAGEVVKKGDVIAGAYKIIDEKIYPCDLYAFISAECSYVYTYTAKFDINNELLARVYEVAKFNLGDFEILSHNITVDNNNTVKVVIKYEKIICGG